MYDSTAL
jgi:hypothetical protein